MPIARTTTIAAFCVAITVFAACPAFATDYTCSGLVLTRTLPGASAPGQHAFSTETRLLLSIDEAEPGRSTMRWTGDPTLKSDPSPWPENARILVENGILAASLTETRNGASSVGSLTIDAAGAFRATESTLLPKGVMFDVVEGTCQKDQK